MPVTKDGLANAVLAVMERDGLDGVNMRAVAAELGVRAPSLYFHVRDKNALLELAADALILDPATLGPELAELAGSGDEPLWRRGLRAQARLFRTHLLGQRDAARLLQGRFGTGPRGFDSAEAGIGFLVGEGFDLADAVQTLYLLMSVYTVGSVAAEQVPMTAAEASGIPPADAVAGVVEALRTLPEDRYPHLRRSADALLGPGLDERFEIGLEIVLDGIAARYATDPPPPG